MSTIFRILSRTDWQAAQSAGVFSGTAHDLRDGFIHFSAAHQLAETFRKHYAGQSDLVLLHVDSDELDRLTEVELKWEVSRGGELFPHLYGSLPTTLVQRVEDFP